MHNTGFVFGTIDVEHDLVMLPKEWGNRAVMMGYRESDTFIS